MQLSRQDRKFPSNRWVVPFSDALAFFRLGRFFPSFRPVGSLDPVLPFPLHLALVGLIFDNENRCSIWERVSPPFPLALSYSTPPSQFLETQLFFFRLPGLRPGPPLSSPAPDFLHLLAMWSGQLRCFLGFHPTFHSFPGWNFVFCGKFDFFPRSNVSFLPARPGVLAGFLSLRYYAPLASSLWFFRLPSTHLNPPPPLLRFQKEELAKLVFLTEPLTR